jgi:hypothetical protein
MGPSRDQIYNFQHVLYDYEQLNLLEKLVIYRM